MAKVQTKQKAKTKKKHWLPIHAPASFNHTLLGETHVTDSEAVKTKSVTLNLMTLTDDPRKQGYSVRFDVTDVKDGKAQTQVIAMGMNPQATKRLIRRNRDKIADSFVLRIAGGRLVRVKPMLVTKTRTSKAAQTEIRLTVRKQLRDLYEKMQFDTIIKDIIEMKTQKLLRDVCSKTHPVRTADIKEIVVLPEDRALTQEMQELMQKEVQEEEKKREQMASAAAAASVDEETPKKPAKKKAAKKDEKKE
ncbi:MAG: hypothetical protein OXR66_05710 [Candidatus Woesearchaeota archaeon]|nr:hypothetical protein [Candidatus Woesearchaeota archaeon]